MQKKYANNFPFDTYTIAVSLKSIYMSLLSVIYVQFKLKKIRYDTLKELKRYAFILLLIQRKESKKRKDFREWRESRAGERGRVSESGEREIERERESSGRECSSLSHLYSNNV
jgi:hypothetical protein